LPAPAGILSAPRRSGARVTAVDFSDGMVAKRRRKPGWEQVQFILHDLTRGLPFPDCSFAAY